MITEIINELVSIWGKSPHDINCGECVEFAQSVIEEMGGESEDLYNLCNLNFDPKWLTELPGHAWILYKGRHYDSESPNGVDDWRELSIFEKFKGIVI